MNEIVVAVGCFVLNVQTGVPGIFLIFPIGLNLR